MEHEEVEEDEDSCLEEVIDSTQLPASLRLAVAETAIESGVIVDVAAIGTGKESATEPEAVSLPQILPATMAEMQRKDRVIGRLITYRQLGRRPNREERARKRTVPCFCC